MRHAQSYETRIRALLNKAQSISLPDTYPLLQAWQSQRLIETHETIYQVKRFRPAIHFFRDDLYGSVNFRARNEQLLKALPIMCNTLPESVLAVVEMAAELHAISLELDALLLHFLPAETLLESLTLAQWVTAYQHSNNPTERNHQIDLIENIGESLKGLIDKPMIGRLLKWATVPASLAGYATIHKFVCDGFFAFEALQTPDEFLKPVIAAERELSKRWRLGELVTQL